MGTLDAGEGWPADLAGAVEAKLAAVERERVVERVWAGDHTVWCDAPTELTDRLGWLRAPERMQDELSRLLAFAKGARDDGFTSAVLLGMGGSSLAPEVMQRMLGSAPGALELTVMDSTDPCEILAVARRLDLERTLFIVSSKSGGTIETWSQMEYFWRLHPAGDQFIAITDAGSRLHKTAEERHFREVFLNDPEVGGRYSALTFFGMVPGALIGADLEGMLARAATEATLTRERPPAKNPAVRAGVEMGVASLAGRDKLTIVASPAERPFGWWLEQLLAESTGKEGKGVLPVEGEPIIAAGGDRTYAVLGNDASVPGPRITHLDALDFWGWEFATAMVGHVLGVNPFDQKSVQHAKDATHRILNGERVDASTPGVTETLAGVQPGDYIALLAYLPRNHANDARMARVRERLGARYGVATTAGFGPRYLHSTGQYHKDGPNTGVFIQIIGEHDEDIAIPGAGYTFGELQDAQALGDLDSLRTLGRRITRTTLAELESLVARL